MNENRQLLQFDRLRHHCHLVLESAERSESHNFFIHSDALDYCASELVRTMKGQDVLLDNCWSMLQCDGAFDERRGGDIPISVDIDEPMPVLQELARALKDYHTIDRAASGLELAFVLAVINPGSMDHALLSGLIRLYLSGRLSKDHRLEKGLDPESMVQTATQGIVLKSSDKRLAHVQLSQQAQERLQDAAKALGSGTMHLFSDRDWLAERAGSTLMIEELIQRAGPVFLKIGAGRNRYGPNFAGDCWRFGSIRNMPTLHLSFQVPMLRFLLNAYEPLLEAEITLKGMEFLPVPASTQICQDILAFGFIEPRHRAIARLEHPPASDITVEWRSLSVALMDRLAGLLQGRLGLSSEELPVNGILRPLRRHALQLEAATMAMDRSGGAARSSKITFASDLF